LRYNDKYGKVNGS
jgi:hypothetical protein